MTSKPDVYQIVTDRMITALEAGTAPWRQPWSTTHGRPQNLDGRAYRGVNTLLLGMSGHASPFWLTFKEAKRRGGTVSKGEHGTLIVFWKQLNVPDRNDPDKRATIPLLRYYYVFNLDQTEECKLPKRVADWGTDAATTFEPVIPAESIVSGYPAPPTIQYNGSAAFYNPTTDAITVPAPEAYPRPEEHYSTLFHELAHSTGHASRLNRAQSGGFGSHDYGREELVAEMTAAFLCAEAGIDSTAENSAAYLSSWIRTIREDTRAVVVAAGAAQRAADHILARTAPVEAAA